jgi:phosphoribosylaminoimidazole-succinocarboxamide synthase
MIATRETLQNFLHTTLETTSFSWLGERYVGKVRDVYTQGSRRFLIATDRQSAFDIAWCTIPLKGQVLNQISAWWFERVADIMPTHLIEVPDENVAVVKNLTMVPIEIVVRGYLTGATGTSAWVNYQQGVRDFCGNRLTEGMRKNQIFEAGPIITPTTKGEHDELISREEIIARGLATPDQWEEISSKALSLFKRGQEVAARLGLILVDTKYEMGYDTEGRLTIADEVHTPDSSRYWLAETYTERFAAAQEPDNIDKEFFRLWLREQGFEYGKARPKITDDIRLMLASKYIGLYERLTGNSFVPPADPDVQGRMGLNLKRFAS